MKNAINPDHYKNHPSGVEAIDIIRHMPFNLGCVYKYADRCLHKHESPIEDIDKALYYIKDYKENLDKLSDDRYNHGDAKFLSDCDRVDSFGGHSYLYDVMALCIHLFTALPKDIEAIDGIIFLLEETRMIYDDDGV